MSSSDLALVLRQVYPRVLAKLVRQAGSLPEAQDAVQEAIARALRKWPKEGLPPAPEGWLVTTARNFVTDQHRRGSHERKYAESLQGSRTPAHGPVHVAQMQELALGTTTCCA